MQDEILDAVVIGAGWAGLAVSYYLAQDAIRHRVLERGRVAETWRTQRWDAFRLNTPNRFTVMPGDEYQGPEPEAFMGRETFVALLEDYVTRYDLPVEIGTDVTELARDAGTRGFRVATSKGPLRARNVVIASGNLNRPRRPPAASALVAPVLQIDGSDYRSAAALPAGRILVVGSSQTGGQIAQDLLHAGRKVFLSTGRVGRVVRRYRGRDIAEWLFRSGLFDVPRSEFLDASGRVIGRPLLGIGHTISLQWLSARGVTLLGRFTGCEGERLTFGDDLAENMRFGDESSAAAKRHIDAFIAREGIDAGPAEPDPFELVEPRLPDPPIRSLDPVEAGLAAVIWCTGFDGDFSWVRVEGALDQRGAPLHENCISAVPGLCYAGLDLAVTRKSGTLQSAREECARVARHIAERCAG